MKKSFKLTHKPGQTLVQPALLVDSFSESGSPDTAVEQELSPEAPQPKIEGRSVVTDLHSSQTRMNTENSAPPARSMSTRKTIEVPEEYFYQVKMRALQRRMKEKDLWAEILAEYFLHHPAQ